MLGAVAGPDTKEYLVFSEETWVFKREWAELKDLVMPAGACIQQIKVTKTGEVKDKVKVSVGKKQPCLDCAYEVQFTNDPRSTVWFTQAGLRHMTEQVGTLCEAGLLPHTFMSLHFFPCWSYTYNVSPCLQVAECCCAENTDTATNCGSNDNSNHCHNSVQGHYSLTEHIHEPTDDRLCGKSQRFSADTYFLDTFHV